MGGPAAPSQAPPSQAASSSLAPGVSPPHSFSLRHQCFLAQPLTPGGIQQSPNGDEGQPVTIPGGRVALHPTSSSSTQTARVLHPTATPFPSSAPAYGAAPVQTLQRLATVIVNKEAPEGCVNFPDI